MNCPTCGGESISGGTRCGVCGNEIPLPLLEWFGSSDPRVGLVLQGRYEVEEFIACGGMGTVFRGKDLELHRPVAIKFLNDRYSSDEEVVERFHREALAAAELEHPNVVPVYGVGEEHGYDFFVMRYLDGATVAESIALRGRLPLTETLRIGVQVCRGLDHVHARGCVHRDIKPANIIVDEHGQAYILDFGILRQQASQLTQTGLVTGTPEYMSPEQARSSSGLDHRSDLYSLGVTLFEMLAGRRPFVADSLVDVLMKQLQEEPPDVSSLADDVPEELDDILRRALAKRPAERFDSAAQMGKALERVLVDSGASLSGIGPSPLREAGRPAMAAGALAMTQALGEAVHPIAISGAPDSAARTEHRLQRMMPLIALLLGVVGLIGAAALSSGDAPAVPRARERRPETARSMRAVPAVSPGPLPSPKREDSSAVAKDRAAVHWGTIARKRPVRKRRRALPGLLRVDSTPTEAVVRIDGRRAGWTPLRRRLRPGHYRISVQKPGHARVGRTVRVTAGRLARLREKLTVLPTLLSVSVRYQGKRSAAAVVVDGKPFGHAPIRNRQVRPGQRQVMVRRPGYVTQQKVVWLTRGNRREVIFNLVRN